ncbi:MAG: transglutaminase domain-containing protein [Phycisphaerae bacterium]|nr:transglutaminase domain-containing protein [Phycisphaerae bacterium]
MRRTSLAVVFALASLALPLGAACQSPPAAPATSSPATPAPPLREQALGKVDRRERDAVAKALDGAGANADQLAKAIVDIGPEMRPGMAFLVATMPERDRTTLTADFLVRNVQLAYAAWRGAPWGHEIDEETFFRYVLPYVNLNERRDDWRADFVNRFQKEAWAKGSRMEAVRWLNDHINDALNVHYHASKRKKPDQSPYESMELSYASCTGLSILLVDACRACGIPARCVGCPAWTKVTGNHTWVEVFGDDRPTDTQRVERWFNVGDTGSDPRGENWVNERCREETDPDDWAHAVWAATWRPTGKHFPLPWEWEIEYVPAINVTRLYKTPANLEIPLSKPGPAIVDVYLSGDLTARAHVTKPVSAATLHLANGEKFDVVVRYADGTREDRTVGP